MSSLIQLLDAEQLDLFDASAEAELYHRSGRPGFFSLLVKKGARKHQRSYLLRDMPKILSLVDYSLDTWISQAEFVMPNRRVVNLARVGLLFVDIDTYTSDLMRTLTLDQQIQRLLFFCAENGIPLPSLIVFSGRGLQAKWILDDSLPRAALPRWNACQKALIEALKPLGADANARDASRVLRLVDSVNSKSGERAQVVDVQGTGDMPTTYDFEYLAEQLLPHTRDQIKQFRADREAKEAQRQKRLKIESDNPKAAIFRGYNGRSLAWARLEDLRKLGELRGGWSDGEKSLRTMALHWQLNFLCLSGAVHPATFYKEAKELAKQLDPNWTFAADELSTLFAKAKAYVAGETIELNDRKWPALYTPRNQTLIDLFGITDDEQRQLRTIITKDLARERNTDRERAKRRAAGVVERSEYESSRQQRAKDRAIEIKRMKNEGLSAKAIAEALGITTRTVFNALKGV
jgi:hypothetical protein